MYAIIKSCTNNNGVVDKGRVFFSLLMSVLPVKACLNMYKRNLLKYSPTLLRV